MTCAEAGTIEGCRDGWGRASVGLCKGVFNLASLCPLLPSTQHKSDQWGGTKLFLCLPIGLRIKTRVFKMAHRALHDLPLPVFPTSNPCAHPLFSFSSLTCLALSHSATVCAGRCTWITLSLHLSCLSLSN